MATESGTEALALEGVNALYGDSHVLYDVSFRLAPGRVLALLGRNGAGKTTCMNTGIGFLPPRDGEVRLFGEPITRLPPEAIARKGIGLVPRGGLKMRKGSTRRGFLAAAGAAAITGAAGVRAAGRSELASTGKTLKILGIACSPRKGMTTAKAVQTALDAAKSVDARIEIELIDLGGMNIAGWSPKPPDDDFKTILPKLQDPAVAGLIIGSPVYYRAASALCGAFVERCSALREPKMLMADKPLGVVAVGAFCNGGQELTIEQIQATALCFGMIPVGGNAPASQGAAVLSVKDDISGDTLGLDTARKVGSRVAEAALRFASRAT